MNEDDDLLDDYDLLDFDCPKCGQRVEFYLTNGFLILQHDDGIVCQTCGTIVWPIGSLAATKGQIKVE